MMIKEILQNAEQQLKEMPSDSPALDAALILSHTLNISREKLFMELGSHLEAGKLQVFKSLLQRRLAGEPVAWITGIREFWGLELKVGPGVLCPRADSETLVETVLQFMPKDGPGALHDCCCGPGTLAVALATERPNWNISASDLSEAVTGYFQQNNQIFTQGKIRYYQSNLLKSIKARFDIIIANPPYLTCRELAEKVAQGWKEPAIALDGGEDGLLLIRDLIAESGQNLKEQAWLFLEAAPKQMPEIENIFISHQYKNITKARDLSGQERVIYGQYGCPKNQ